MSTSQTDAWELAGWDAVETAQRVARGEIGALEVTRAALARARDAARLNALVSVCEERALAAAGAAPHGALFGVPTAIKDLAQLAGVRTAWGSAGSGEFVATRSDPSVQAMEQTGVIAIGKSATPEFGLTATTEPLAFGPCHNPWALGHTPGGSSGGAAALVAAGVVPIAHASDGGGSIRIPAACAGLVGLKPSRRRFDMEGSGSLPVNIAVHGVLSRTVRDTVAFWSAVEGALRKQRLPPIGEVARAPARRLKLGVYVDAPNGASVHPEVTAAVEQAGRLCASLGHVVESIACPFDGQVVRDFERLWGFVAFGQVKLARRLMHRAFDASKVEPFSLAFGRHFSGHLGTSLAALLRLRGFAKSYARILERYDLLVSPTVAQPAPRHGHLATDVEFGVALPRLLHFAPFTGIINLAGAPAISLPLGRSAEGLPIGVHFAAAAGQERLLLELASELEAAAPWPRLAPRSAWSAQPT